MSDDAVKTLVAELERMQRWVDDLQSGMYINCVYCGYRYGPADEVPATMADALKQHIEQCPKHPMSALKAENAALRRAGGFLANEAANMAHRAGYTLRNHDAFRFALLWREWDKAAKGERE